MTRCADCPSTVECWQHEETNAPPCRGIAELEAEVAAARDLRERLSRRYATRAAALAAINPAHTLAEWWDLLDTGIWSAACTTCGLILAIEQEGVRIQLTDAAHEAVCVPFGGEGR